MGVTVSPQERVVTRFHDAFPQYRVHHLLRTAGVESALARLGGVAVAGAAYRGVGIPACIASGRAAARRSCERRLPRRGRVAAPSVAAGVLLALSLPPWGWWPLGLVGAALLYWRLAGLPLRTRIWSGWLAGLGCYAIGLAWARAFNWYGAVVLVLDRGALLRRGRRRHATAARTCPGLRRCVHPGRVRPHDVALRRAAPRRRVPRPGRRPARRAGPPRRARCS